MELNDTWDNVVFKGTDYLKIRRALAGGVAVFFPEDSLTVEEDGITMTSILFCRHGGIIYPETSGQARSMEEALAYMDLYLQGESYSMSRYDFLNQPLSGTSENSGENGTRDFGTRDFGTRDLGNRDFGTIDFGFSEEPYTFADHKKLVYGNAFKDLEERDRTVEEALSDEIESGEIDLADVDYEAREQIADYYKRSQEDQDGKEYLVRGALLRCSCGTNSRKLNLSPCHGVYFKEHPLVHKMDCKQGEGENITWYGVCDQADLETEEIVVVNDRGQKQTGRKCCPEIIGSWRNTYSKAQIADNHEPSKKYELYDALTVDSYLICRHGGIITPVNSGQSREVLLEEFKNGQEAYDKIVKYDKENSVSDEMGAESEDSLTTDDHMNEPDKEEEGTSLSINIGTVRADRQKYYDQIVDSIEQVKHDSLDENVFAAELKQFNKIFKENRDTYTEISEATDIPAVLIAAIHYRESGCNFATVIKNGDKVDTTGLDSEGIKRKFIEGSIKTLKEHDNGITLTLDSDIPMMMTYAVGYNGLGYMRDYNTVSPYVFSGTSIYKTGKYISNGNYSATTVDAQPGVYILVTSVLNSEEEK